ncbi:MAG: tRNA (adenosine(37)-N6)-threonylcarbamoyltransferase complex dimerization subunit type 1 TsaB [Proteobacteria bacterium]|nr:tRNA (adenosine(37)-N6)-threonylcarbamoyltransferase complex dimerization subunit type 1 TsaB [Pseudomonadota bacterium]
MILLALETSTKLASLAIVDTGSSDASTPRTLVALDHETDHRVNDLLVVIDRACRDAGIAPTDLGAVAVGAGPGSFTGLRIGMATAKGIAFAVGCPLWAVSSLAALAHAGAGAIRVAALDARKGEVYAGVYRADGGLVGVEAAVHPSELVRWVTTTIEAAPELGAATDVRYVGDAARTFPDHLGALGFQDATPSGLAVARCALAGARVDIVVDGKPAYLRLAEAEVMYPDGVPGALPRRT